MYIAVIVGIAVLSLATAESIRRAGAKLKKNEVGTSGSGKGDRAVEVDDFDFVGVQAQKAPRARTQSSASLGSEGERRTLNSTTRCPGMSCIYTASLR